MPLECISSDIRDQVDNHEIAILGDMNTHTKYFDGYRQNRDYAIGHIYEEHDLVLANTEDKCLGKPFLEARRCQSSIDCCSMLDIQG